MKKIHYLAFLAFIACACTIQQPQQPLYKSILSGIPWYTENGENVSAHGANIIKEGDKFYLFGEYKNNTNNRFEGFSCYSSTDLMNWEFESIAMPHNESGRLSGPECIGERHKVMKCPLTGEYIMYFHADSNGCRNPAVEYAVARNITGPYKYTGPLMFGDKLIFKREGISNILTGIERCKLEKMNFIKFVSVLLIQK